MDWETRTPTGHMDHKAVTEVSGGVRISLVGIA
jgi:hypothetical protein